MKAEFTVEQIREFVKRGYTSVAARMCASMLQHFDDAKVKNEGIRESEKESCPKCGSDDLFYDHYIGFKCNECKHSFSRASSQERT